MNKPDWNYAPRWAKYLAMDISGTWWWYEVKPEYLDGEWDCVGMTSIAEYAQDGILAVDTMEQRP